MILTVCLSVWFSLGVASFLIIEFGRFRYIENPRECRWQRILLCTGFWPFVWYLVWYIRKEHSYSERLTRDWQELQRVLQTEQRIRSGRYVRQYRRIEPQVHNWKKEGF